MSIDDKRHIVDEGRQNLFNLSQDVLGKTLGMSIMLNDEIKNMFSDFGVILKSIIMF